MQQRNTKTLMKAKEKCIIINTASYFWRHVQKTGGHRSGIFPSLSCGTDLLTKTWQSSPWNLKYQSVSGSKIPQGKKYFLCLKARNRIHCRFLISTFLAIKCLEMAVGGEKNMGRNRSLVSPISFSLTGYCLLCMFPQTPSLEPFSLRVINHLENKVKE